MKTNFWNSFFFAFALTAATAGAAEFCDFTLNPQARDGHTPADTNRYFTVCSSSHYEAHPSSVMLPDDKTIVAFWDHWQGGPCGSAAISKDAGRTWTRIDERIPKEFSECYDEPKVFRFVDPKTGKARLRVFASYGKAGDYDWRGTDNEPLAKAMPSVLSEDDGQTWKFLPPLGADFACVVGFSGMVRLKDGSYLGVFCRGTNPNGDGGTYRVMGSFSRDGGLTWEKPFELAQKQGCSFLIPTVFRSPDGTELCCIVGSVGGAAWVCYSTDEGVTWSDPMKTEAALSGFEHSVGVLPDGRLVIALHCGSELRGWVGSYKVFRARKADAGFEARLFHNYGGAAEVGTPNVHVRKDGEVVVVAYSQLDLYQPMPVVAAMQFKPDDVERAVRMRKLAKRDFEAWGPFAGTPFKPLEIVKLYGPFAQEVVQDGKKERTIKPFDGKKAYIEKCGGANPRELNSKTGCFEIEKHANHNTGNAAILVWTVNVKEDCKARLRLIGAPSARCCVNEKVVLPATFATIFEPRTTEIALKKGDNDIAVMVYQPKHQAAVEAHMTEKPMYVGAALELQDFKCVRSKKLELRSADADVSIDDVSMDDDALEF